MKQSSLGQLKVVFNFVTKNNSKNLSENVNSIIMKNDRFKKIKEANDSFIKFLTDIGFTKTEGKDENGNDAKYKYLTKKEI